MESYKPYLLYGEPMTFHRLLVIPQAGQHQLFHKNQLMGGAVSDSSASSVYDSNQSTVIGIVTKISLFSALNLPADEQNRLVFCDLW
jgi:hypothetical protein